MATRTRADAQKFTHSNFATATSSATKTLPSNTTSILISNTDSTDSVLVSLDGTNYVTIPKNMSLSVDCDNLANYKIKSSANTPAVECVYASEN